MTGDERSPRSEREAMVVDQLRRRRIADERVLSVMGELPREAFLPSGQQPLAYADAALPIAAGQTISQPYMVARMTELLGVRPGDRVLEIGTGSGYQAAVLARLGATVVSYERQPELAQTARARLKAMGLNDAIDVRLGDGSLGDAADGPFDGVLVTAAAPRIPEALPAQLAVGARLVIPVGPRDRQELLVVERRGEDDWVEWSDGACVFVPLVGEGGYPG